MNLVQKRNQKKNFGLRFPSGQSGSILILVVWMIALFSFWVLTSATAGIFSLNVGRRFEGDMKTYALARSAIPYVQKILEDDETPKHDGEGESIFKKTSTSFLKVSACSFTCAGTAKVFRPPAGPGRVA